MLSLCPGEEGQPRISLNGELKIAAIATPPTQNREEARRLCREALRGMIAARLDCSPEAVRLISEPAKPPRVNGHPEIGISISHESGLSLIAANFSGAVGVDLLKLEQVPVNAPELLALAGDYLGPRFAAQFAGLAGDQQAPAFADAWTGHEARLKCLGLALMEWSEALEQRLGACVLRPLDLPVGYVGAVAVRRSD